jgi:PAS domain S-box-containing protein
MSGEAFERLRVDLSTTFISLPAEQIDDSVRSGLGRIAAFLDLERATLYELSEAGTELMSTTWAEDGALVSPPVTSDNDPIRWKMLVERSGVLFTSDHAALPEVWAASVPLTIGGETIGALKVASTTRQLPWSDDMAARLAALAEIFANAMARKRAARALLVVGTELQEARTEAREREQRFRLVADTAPVLIWMSDASRLSTYFNKPWLDFVGRPMSAELGNGWRAGVHAEDLPGCVETYTRAFDRRDRFTMQYRLRRHDGEDRWVLATGVPRFDQHGAFDGYIGSCIDITNEKLAEEALAALGGRLMEAQEQERTRIARELHDDICQRLTVLAIELQQMNVGSAVDVHSRAEELFNRAVDISQDVQALSHQLHCSKLEYLGIAAAIRGFCVEFARQHEHATIDFTSSGVPTHLPRDVSLCLFRVLQEALRNAVKHSGVRHVEAQLHGTSNVVLLTIRDHGRGFEPEVAMHGHGLGLISMRERVSLVKGTIVVTSKPGCGTEISMRIPITGGHGRVSKTSGTTKHVHLIPSDRAS